MNRNSQYLFLLEEDCAQILELEGLCIYSLDSIVTTEAMNIRTFFFPFFSGTSRNSRTSKPVAFCMSISVKDRELVMLIELEWPKL